MCICIKSQSVSEIFSSTPSSPSWWSPLYKYINLHISIHIYMYICTYIHIYVLVYIYIIAERQRNRRPKLLSSTISRLSLWSPLYKHINFHTGICTYIYTHTYIHIYIHMYIYIITERQRDRRPSYSPRQHLDYPCGARLHGPHHHRRCVE